MGQEQSRNGTGRGAQNAPVVFKTCYYEVLGVERQATEDDIKKAYRKKALELHPDRNYGDVENATIKFAEVSAAYEVLSDPQERAWYDSHRESILRGDSGPTSGEDEEREYNAHVTSTRDIVNLISRFHPGIPFTDASNGFYGILRKTFQTLADEEDSATNWEGVEAEEYPDFGNATADYETVVRPFYRTWMAFSTKKAFAWRDQYQASDAQDRAGRRFIEKENKKYRDAGIREFNEAVVALVGFARRRDPRYLPNSQTDAERQKILRDAAVSQAQKARAANKAKFSQHVVPEWAKSIAPVMDEDDSEGEGEEVVEHIECVVCNKIFKSEKQYEAHERSKKHIKTVQHLQREMRKENQRLGLPDDAANTPVEGFEKLEVQDHESDSVEKEVVTEDDVAIEENSDKEGRIVQDNNVKTTSTSESSDIDDDYAPREEVESRLAPSVSEDIASKSSAPATTATSEASDNDDESPGQPKLGKAKAKRAKKAARQQSEAVADGGPEFKCAACSDVFSSKTKLFNHIKSNLTHAQPVASNASMKAKKW